METVIAECPVTAKKRGLTTEQIEFYAERLVDRVKRYARKLADQVFYPDKEEFESESLVVLFDSLRTYTGKPSEGEVWRRCQKRVYWRLIDFRRSELGEERRRLEIQHAYSELDAVDRGRLIRMRALIPASKAGRFAKLLRDSEIFGL